MSTAVATTADSYPRENWLKWMIAIGASLGAVLEVLDTSIVNVALTDMQGTLGATLSEIGWVITSYAMANVIIIPLSAWLGDYFGKKNYFIFSLIGFTLSSILCGMATNLPMLILARILQGLAGGGLLAKAQSILYETFPPSQQGMAQAIFGIGVMVGPALGPTLGGYLTDTVGWRWIFFINIPFGILAVLIASMFFPKDVHKEGFNRRVDWWGILFLAVGLGAFQTFLEQGQSEDWFNSRFIILMAALSISGVIAFIWRELSIDYPAVNLRVLRYKSLAAGSMFSSILGLGLYGAIFAIPIFAQTILHFTAYQTGMLLLPSAIASGFMMPLVGNLARRIDARILIAIGALGLAWVMIDLATINPGTGEDSLYWPLIGRGIATVMMYLPLTLATIGPLPKEVIPAATGFFNLMRQLGGSIGIAILTTLLARRENFHRSVLVDHINAYNPQAVQQLNMLAHGFQAKGAGAPLAQMQALKAMEGSVNLQASILSFADIFFIVSVVFVASLLLLLFLGSGRSNGSVPVDAH